MVHTIQYTINRFISCTCTYRYAYSLISSQYVVGCRPFFYGSIVIINIPPKIFSNLQFMYHYSGELYLIQFIQFTIQFQPCQFRCLILCCCRRMLRHKNSCHTVYRREGSPPQGVIDTGLFRRQSLRIVLVRMRPEGTPKPVNILFTLV